MEPSRNWEASRNFDRDPMAEIHTNFGKVCSEQDIPLGKVVKKERATRLDSADALRNPTLTPLHIFVVGPQVIAILPIFLSEIEGRISKDHIDDSGFDVRQHFHAVGSKQGSKRGRINWLDAFAILQPGLNVETVFV
jgi:hypothetical protein